MLAAEQTILQNPEESHKKGMVFEYITSQICRDFAQESYKINGATKKNPLFSINYNGCEK